MPPAAASPDLQPARLQRHLGMRSWGVPGKVDVFSGYYHLPTFQILTKTLFEVSQVHRITLYKCDGSVELTFSVVF